MAAESGNEIGQLLELAKVFGAPGAIALLGWWLKSQFSNIQDVTKAWLASHEKQDERRHRQNLVRFAKINGKLGIADHQQDDDDDDDDG